MVIINAFGSQETIYFMKTFYIKTNMHKTNVYRLLL